MRIEQLEKRLHAKSRAQSCVRIINN